MNLNESKLLIGILCAAYPAQASRLNETAIAGMVASWADLLSDVPFAAAKAALAVHARTCKWLPSVAEIREAVATGGERQRPGGDAWGDVRKLMSSTKQRTAFSAHRFPREHDVEDPITWRCIEAMGWLELCNSESPESDRARFIELYDKLAAGARHKATAGDALGRLREASAAGELVGGVARRLAGGS